MSRLSKSIAASIARDQAFLMAYYGDESPTKGNKTASARAVGFSESTAEDQAGRVFRRYDKRKFQEALKAVGVTNLLMGYRLRKMIEEGADKDAIGAIRLALAARGEATDQQSGTTINATGQVMVIVGANASRINALRTAKALPTAEELEAEENARCQARLDELKARNTPRGLLAEKQVSDIHEAGSGPSGEVAASEG